MKTTQFSWSLVVVGLLAVLNGGYMVFDGVHRITTGDFIRIEGQLGPWAHVTEFVGIDPMSMAPVFLLFGIFQLVCATALLTRRKWGYRGAAIMALLTLWYLVFGTLTSIVQLILLAIERKRREPTTI